MSGGPCPYCGRIMSVREAAEQAACNDCYGPLYLSEPPDPEPRPAQMAEYLTIGEAAELLRVSRKSLYNWRARDDGPPAAVVGSRLIYERDALIAWVENRTSVRPPRRRRPVPEP